MEKEIATTYLPKIGIRPIIDGRLGGIRESLEDQTMGMARKAAEFLEKNLRHPDGSKVNVSLLKRPLGEWLR